MPKVDPVLALDLHAELGAPVHDRDRIVTTDARGLCFGGRRYGERREERDRER